MCATARAAHGWSPGRSRTRVSPLRSQNCSYSFRPGMGCHRMGRWSRSPVHATCQQRSLSQMATTGSLSPTTRTSTALFTGAVQIGLHHTGRVVLTVVAATETLTIQWLGELWRKYHQAFVLLDEKRLDDVAKDHGESFNPFDVHRHAILGLDTLVRRRRLTEQAVEAGIDLLVVDEAHHLKRPKGHPGNEAYRAVAPIAALGRHVLLLTATPLGDDAHGFFRLLQLLRPEEFPEEESFDERLARREPLPPCTSSTRRVDIGGLPPRVPVPVEIIDGKTGWEAVERLVRHLRAQPAENPLAKRRKADRVFRALASP